jgi:hypothetical protein
MRDERRDDKAAALARLQCILNEVACDAEARPNETRG